MRRLLPLAFLLCPLAHAQTTITSTTTPGTYNWSSTATWVGGVVPGTGVRAACSTNGVIIVVDVNTIVGDSPAAGTNVVTFTNGCLLAFAQNVSLKSQGGTLAPIRKVAGGSIVFDSTGAGSPTTTPYTLSATTFTDDATHPTSWTVGNFFTITANIAGTNWRWANPTAGSGTSGVTNMLIQNCGDPIGTVLSFTGTVTNGSNSVTSMSGTAGILIGDPISGAGIPGGAKIATIGFLTVTFTGTAATSTNTGTAITVLTIAPCFSYTPGGSHGSLNIGGVGTPVIFDTTCGVTWGAGYTSADSWDVQSVTFKNTYPICWPWNGVTGFNLPSGTRLFDTVVFDLPPLIESHGSFFDHSIFLKNWVSPISFVGGGYTVIEDSMVVDGFQSGTLTWDGNLGIPVQDIVLTNDVVVTDPTTTFVAGVPTAQTPLATGTVTSATTNPTFSTFTDSTKSFTTNQFAPQMSSGGAIYGVVITGGTGAGEANTFISNTATVGTVIENWEVQPIGGVSTYAIYKGVTNCHVTNGTGQAAGTIIPPYNGNHFVGPTLFDNNCDGFHSMTSAISATCNQWWAVWSSTHHDPNTGLTNYAKFSSVSRSGVLYSASVLVASSVDPATDGGVHWTVVSTFAGLISGCAVYEFDYNVMHPNMAHDNVSTLVSPGLALFITKHNTAFTGAQSMIQFNEQSSAAQPNAANSPQQFVMDSNLAWADPTRTYVLAFAGTSASTLGPWILNDIFAPSGPSTPTDIIDPCAFTGGASTCDYNGEYGQLHPGWCFNPAGDNQPTSTPYVNVACTVPQGVHDVNGDPQFANKWASPQSWACSIGVNCTADPVAAMPFVYACMMKLNDASGFNPACTVAALYTYLQNSVGFSNVAYFNTALGGATNIGAGQYIPPAAGPNVLGSGSVRASGSILIQ